MKLRTRFGASQPMATGSGATWTSGSSLPATPTATAYERQRARQVLKTPSSERGLYASLGKRALDVLLSATALIMTSPLLLACALAIWRDSGRPIFYRQWRVGQRGKLFRIVKLRTMVQRADKLGLRLTADGDPRVTKVGRLLRKAKLDELPQLFNVLWGEMSLVGPRPELPEYVAKYASHERIVLSVKPGITGPASVSYIDEEQILAGRTDKEDFYINTVMKEKLCLDIPYCCRVSFAADLKIVFLTMERIFMRSFRSLLP